ncbi:MAG: hypothetical protein RLZZ385_764 [Pseudomonadota bacterium]|jgi:F-type H+-transporting ATPase subunit delta
MADLITLARPYAKAAFQVALAEGDLARWSKMLALAAAVSKVDQVRAILTSPSFSAPQLAATVVDICGDELNQKGRNFISLLAENKRLNLLTEISSLYEQLKAQQEKSVDVEITTAYAINAATADSLAAALNKRLQRDIKLSTSVDKGLIGGAVIKAGDMVIDNSVRGKLNKLAEAMNA